jgi:hypothetical protein
VHHDAIDAVYDLALGFWHKAKEAGLFVAVAAALGYAMQILCANPQTHLLVVHPDLWASDDEGRFRDHLPESACWAWRHPVGSRAIEIQPAIIHLPKSRGLLN